MATGTETEFMTRYDPDGTRTLAEIVPVRDADGNSPFIVVRHGEFTAVLALMPFDGDSAHLCIDVHSFVGGLDAAAGVFGMTEGRRVRFPETGLTSHGWEAARLVSVLIGAQAGQDDPDAQATAAADLKKALAYVDSEGFGDSVDYDSVIEAAARAYLAAITR